MNNTEMYTEKKKKKKRECLRYFEHRPNITQQNEMKTFTALMYSHAPCAVYSRRHACKMEDSYARERVCASVRLSFCESNALLLKACRFFFFSHLKLLASVSNRRNKSIGAVRMVTHAGSFRNIFTQ